MKNKYTDEYLKEIFIDTANRLGRVPKRSEVKHGNTIAQRFGGGSYNKAIIALGYKSRISNRKIRENLKTKLAQSTAIEVYEMVLRGEIKQFPQYFWCEISEQELRELLKYFFEEKLGWTIEDIKDKVDADVFIKHKLGGGMFQTLFDGSPFRVVDFTYPEQIREWELKSTPVRYWTYNKSVKVAKYIIEKEKWTDEDIKNRSISQLFAKYRLTTIYLRFFNGNPFKLIDTIYPNKFKPWEFPRVSPDFWNIETGKQATKWLLEEKLKWTDEDIKQKYSYNTFKEYRLQAMLNQVFNCSPFKALNSVYPNKFTERDLNKVPINYWTKEKAIKEIKNILDELSEDEIKKYVTINFFIENRLGYPFEKYFKKRPFLVLDTIYPQRFNKEDFDIRV